MHILIMLCAVGLFGLLMFLIDRYAESWAFFLMSSLMIVFVLLVAKWYAYFAPGAKTVKSKSWISVAGTDMQTNLELVQFHSSELDHEIWRLSVYEQKPRRLKRRTMIGDTAEFLGEPGGYYWFYIRGRFYSKKSGLTAFDRQTAEIKFNQPRSEGVFEAKTKNTHIITMLVAGEETDVDLKQLAASIEEPVS